MNISSLPQLVVAWLKGQSVDRLQAGNDQAAQNAFKPGASYEGRVLEGLANGRSLVQVGNQALDMQLPQPAKPGDMLRLTFLNANPRPTFALAPAQATAASALTLSQAAQQVNALIRYAQLNSATATAPAPGTALQPTPGSNPALANALSMAAASGQRAIVSNPAILLVPLSTASGLVANVPVGVIPGLALTAEMVAGARRSLAAHTSLGAEGVVAERGHAGERLPMRLQQTVKESGLFYESHLGRWVKGEMPLDAIQREPQARLAQMPGAMANLPELEGMPAEAARIAARQVLMLEGQPFVWQGQAWPGQRLEWLVEERGADAEADPNDGQKWRSRLRLNLPRLGELAAELDIGGQGLRIRLVSQSETTLAEIEAALPALGARMRGAELNLTSLRAELALNGES